MAKVTLSIEGLRGKNYGNHIILRGDIQDSIHELNYLYNNMINTLVSIMFYDKNYSELNPKERAYIVEFINNLKEQ